MATVAKSFKLIDIEESNDQGTHTATVEWELVVEISASYADMIPTAVAIAINTTFPGTLPGIGAQFPGFPLTTCRGLSCKRKDGGVYSFIAKYSNENSNKDDDEAGNDPNPLNDRPVILPTAGMRERALSKDRDGKAILNTAGDPISQSIEDNTIGLSVTVNVEADDNIEALAVSLRNTTNDSPIQIGRWFIDTNMARFILPDGWLSTPKERNDIVYYEFKYEIHIDEIDRHYGYPLNAGFRELKEIAAVDTPVTILLKDGSEPSDPVPLDINGHRIEHPDPDNAIYVEVKKYFEADYTVLKGVSAWAGP